MYYLNKITDTQFSVSKEPSDATILQGDWGESTYMDEAFLALTHQLSERTEEDNLDSPGFSLRNDVN